MWATWASSCSWYPCIHARATENSSPRFLQFKGTFVFLQLDGAVPDDLQQSLSSRRFHTRSHCSPILLGPDRLLSTSKSDVVKRGCRGGRQTMQLHSCVSFPYLLVEPSVPQSTKALVNLSSVQVQNTSAICLKVDELQLPQNSFQVHGAYVCGRRMQESCAIRRCLSS